MLYTRAVLSLYALLCCVVAPMSPVHEDGPVDVSPTRDDAERQREVVRASWQERQHAAPNDTPERPQGVVRPSLRQEDAVEQNDGRRVRRRLEGTLVTQYSTCTVCVEKKWVRVLPLVSLGWLQWITVNPFRRLFARMCCAGDALMLS